MELFFCFKWEKSVIKDVDQNKSLSVLVIIFVFFNKSQTTVESSMEN